MKRITILLLLVISFSCAHNKKEENKKESEIQETKIQYSEYTGELSSGTIKRIENFPSKYVRPRNVDVWLPENYSESTKYAVLYMHDGQMLFDASATWNKQEWEVDEVASRLMKEGITQDFIVVAMWNHSDIRHSDYYPQKPFDLIPQDYKETFLKKASQQYGSTFLEPNSDNYLKFIVEEVKPFIDANFSVKSDVNNTFISGSSMGGLISMYAICEYPNIFSGAGCLSTHWPGFAPKPNSPIPETFFKYLEENIPSAKTHKMYFDYGTTTLDETYLPFQYRVDEILKLKGFDDSNSKNLKFEGAAHDELSWAKRLDIPFTFFLKK